MVTPFYTIGHGTRPLHDFVELLNSDAVMFVVDVPHRAAIAHQSAI